jgi:hypothetical protein
MGKLGLMHRRQTRLLYNVMRNIKQQMGDLNQSWASREIASTFSPKKATDIHMGRRTTDSQ